MALTYRDKYDHPGRSLSKSAEQIKEKIWTTETGCASWEDQPRVPEPSSESLTFMPMSLSFLFHLAAVEVFLFTI